MLNKVYRANDATFVNPITHKTIHFLETRSKGAKFDLETGVVFSSNHFNIFVNTQAFKHEQFLFH
jgi:hypothetical protein